jgi:hypothetical protein
MAKPDELTPAEAAALFGLHPRAIIRAGWDGEIDTRWDRGPRVVLTARTFQGLADMVSRDPYWTPLPCGNEKAGRTSQILPALNTSGADSLWTTGSTEE